MISACIAGSIAATSAFCLYNDYQKRCDFNKFKLDGSSGNYVMLNGNVSSTNPKIQTSVFDTASETPTEIIGTQLRTYSKHKHTFYRNNLIYENSYKQKFYIPTQETYERWVNVGTKKYFVPNIEINGLGLNFMPESDIEWDSTSSKKVDGSKIDESVLLNKKYRTVFVKKNPDSTCTVKFMSNTEDKVVQNIRCKHYGISNWTTGFTAILLATSIVYLCNSQTNKSE